MKAQHFSLSQMRQSTFKHTLAIILIAIIIAAVMIPCSVVGALELNDAVNGNTETCKNLSTDDASYDLDLDTANKDNKDKLMSVAELGNKASNDFAAPANENLCRVEIDEVTFEGSFQDMINYHFLIAPKVTLTLLEDCNVDFVVELRNGVTDSEKIIDLNGHKLFFNKYSKLFSHDGKFGPINFKIKDSSNAKTGVIACPNSLASSASIFEWTNSESNPVIIENARIATYDDDGTIVFFDSDRFICSEKNMVICIEGLFATKDISHMDYGYITPAEGSQLVVNEDEGTRDQYPVCIQKKSGLVEIDRIVLDQNSYTYNGEQIKPKFTVYDTDDEEITEGFTVTYSNNTNVGKNASVEVEGDGETVEGSASALFEITQADNSIKNFSCADINVGELPAPSAQAEFGLLTFSYSDSESGTFGPWSTENPAGTYYVKASVPETTNYKGAEEIKQFKVIGKSVLPTMEEAIAMLKDKYFTGLVESGEGRQIPLAFFIDKFNTGQEVVDGFSFVFDGEYDKSNPQYFNIVEGSTGADFQINYEDSFWGAQKAVDVFLGSDKQPYKVAILVKDYERDITGTLNNATELITEAELFSMMGSKYYCEYDDESYGMSVHYQNSLLKENNKFVLHIKASFEGEIIEDSVDLDKFYFAARLQNNTLHYCWGKQHGDSFDPNLSLLKVNNGKIVSFSYLGHDLLLDENPSISTVEISKSYNYTGSQIKPSGADVVVKDSSGNEVESSNYELSYGDNVNAGKGTVTAKGIEGKIEGEATGEFTINKASVVIPAEDKTVYTYNGEEQTYKVESSDKYLVSNDKRTNAGSQTVTISLLDPDNYQWENGSSDEISYTFTINKATVTIPAADTSKFVYNGEEQTYKLAISKYYEIANNVQTNAGRYTVSASLKDQENTVWSDNTTAAQVYDFVIAKADVPEKEKTASGILKINKGSECNISIVTKETAQFGTPYTTKEGVKAEIVSQENGNTILKISTTQDLKFTDPDFEVTVPVESDNYSYTFVAKISIDQEHTHSMIVFPATEATQKTAGHKVYYQCTLCNKYFEDEAGKTEITNLDQWLDGRGKTEDSWETQFTNHKNAKIAALKAMKRDGDSQAVTDMIDKAIADIEAMKYDPDKTLDENLASADKVAEETEKAVEKQRAEDEKKKQEEPQSSGTESGSAQTGDMTYVVVGGLMLCVLGAGVLAIRKRREI